MGLLGSKDQVTKSTTVPWDAAQPYLKKIMGGAQTLFNTGQGFNAPGFQTWNPMSSQTKGALNGMMGASKRAGPNQLPGLSMGALSGILGGATNQKYNDLYANSDNAHFEAATDNQADKIYDQVQRGFSGLGRVGSAADTGALVDQIGGFREQALSNNWNQNIANQRGILGDQTQGQLGAVAAAPGAYDSQFAPYRIQAQVGSAYDDLNQRKLQSRLDNWNTKQQSGWNRLGALQGAVTGSGNGATSTTQTVKGASNPFGGALGGALGGASLLGPWGALAGGALGLLSGL